MPALQIIDALVAKEDPANKAIQGRTVPRTFQYNYVQEESCAAQIVARDLRKYQYSYASVVFKANRHMFKYEPGDLIHLTLSKHRVYTKIFRIAKITEDSPESEIITVYAMEDHWYMNVSTYAQ